MTRISKTAALLSAVLAPALACAAPTGDWKIHPTFDANVVKVIDTPSKTFFQSLAQDYTPGIELYSKKYPFLFEYDKDADELRSLSKRNALSGDIVGFIDYNPVKKYLVVVYDDGNIDIISDDGTTHNIPGLASASFPTGKGVNSATFDNDKNHIWLATDFGYLVIDDSKFQIAKSNVLDRKINSIGRIADRIVMFDENSAWTIDASEKFPTMNSFVRISGIENPVYLLPLSSGGDTFAYTTGPYSRLYLATLTDGQLGRNSEIGYGNLYNITPNSEGYYLSYQDKAIQLRSDGSTSVVTLPEELRKINTGSWNFTDFVFVKDREGLSERRYSADDNSWTLTRGAILPNAPGVFRSTAMAYNPRYGMLVNDHSVSRFLYSYQKTGPSHLSTLKGGFWEYLAPIYRKPEWANALVLPNGIAVDPDNPDYVYFGSWGSGIVRLNLADPEDVIRFTVPDDPRPAIGTIVDVIEKNPKWKNHVLINSVAFDRGGNLWGWSMTNRGDSILDIYVWPAEERRKGNLRGWTRLQIEKFETAYDLTGYVCTTPANNGYALTIPGPYGGPLLSFYNGGTPTDPSDDRHVIMENLTDQDGSTVNKDHLYAFFEDSSTGLVWVGGTGGVFTVNPRQTLTSPGRVSRIKVARNDGTNLADYLLNGVTVFAIEEDASGRKYFGTDGGGIVMTTSDGREILGQLTTDNSYIPSNIVYSLKYNPESNSMMVSTANGIAEYFPAGSTSAENGDAVKIYPNPVRPDYYGWVNIEGLSDGSMVKIVDSAGNLVKELGFVSGGAVKWDVSNMSLKRVRSGVYFVLASSGPSGTDAARIGKILVIN